MRLRYLRVGGVPALSDVALRFYQEPVFRRPYGMHFVVGVNGSGKTRLLAALVEVFLSLEQGRLPPFPVTLAYELGREGEGTLAVESDRVCWLHHPGDESLARFAVLDRRALGAMDLDTRDWDAFPDEPVQDPVLRGAIRRLGPFSSIGAGERDEILPRAVLVYTSGALALWDDLFSRLLGDAALLDAELALSAERPADWDRAREERLAGTAESTPRTTGSGGTLEPDGSAGGRGRSRVVLLSSPLVPLAAWAAVLDAVRAPAGSGAAEGRRGFVDAMRRVGWTRAVTLGLRLELDEDAVDSLDAGERALLRRLHRVATFARRDPDPGTGRLFAFDLDAPVQPDAGGADETVPGGTTAAALAWAFGSEAPTPYDAFRVLRRWAETGTLTGVTFAITKEGVEGLVTWDDLSDGERLYVGRMALLHLLRGTEGALVVLDEPETHFNDAWKREMVDVIDGVMRNQTGEVVISTHSSLALTDAFDSEIILVQREPVSGDVRVLRTPVPTFGGSPDQIMRHVFGAPNTTGQRAAEYLDLVLLAVSHPDVARVAWDPRADADARRTAISALAELTRRLPHAYGTGAEREELVEYLLRSLHTYARRQTGRDEPTLAQALDAVQRRLGTGYYEFELIRRAAALAE
jgi:hypothetical protein